MDGIILVLVYLMAGILFLKLYKTYFPVSYSLVCNFLYYVFYDKDDVYEQFSASIWFVLIFYPFILFWLIISRSLKYATRLIKWWVE